MAMSPHPSFHRQLMSGIASFALLAGLLSSLPGSFARPADDPALPPVPANAAFGIAHVSYADGSGTGPQSTRYARATNAGATWNRWALYWTDVERSAGSLDYSAVDARVDADRAAGLEVNAVLLATPAFYATAGSPVVPQPRLERRPAGAPQLAAAPAADSAISAATSPPSGLYNSVFADGSDVPDAGKAVNANNPWARFVATTVARYNGRVSVWEMWNEPDFSAFWSGSVSDYVRLLKVGYLAAKAANPTATVLVGGMMYWQWVNTYGTEHAWLRSFLTELDRDPARATSGYYFDGIPWHWYSRPADILQRTVSARAILAQHGITGKAMWVNEANAPACGEPPVYAPCARPGDAGYNYMRDGYKGSATSDEQAAFVIQAAAYGLAAGLDRFFMFQHYDDGNGEAFGLFRNDGSERPAYQAYQVAARYLRGASSATRYTLGDYEQILGDADQGGVRQRVAVVWKRTAGAGEVRVPGAGSALVVTQSGQTWTAYTSGDAFVLSLAGATDNRNFSGDVNDYIIGGTPLVLIGTDLRPVTGAATPTPAPTAVPTATPAPTATPTATPRPVIVGGLLSNGGFETGAPCPTSWTCSGSGPVELSADAHSGVRAALLGSVFYADTSIGGGSNSTISQSATLPGSGVPSLRFAYKLATTESIGAPGADWHTWPDRLEVIIVDPTYTAHYDYVTLEATGWIVATVPLSAYRGQTVTVIFNVYQSSAERPTTVTIDDVEVWVDEHWFPLITARGHSQ